MFSINSVHELEKLSHVVKWQYFEKLVAWIFEQNGFDARQNVVIKTGTGKRQFDVIADKYGRTFLVECKKWKSIKQRESVLKSAVRKHLERCNLYSMKVLEENMTNRTPDSEVETEARVPGSAYPEKKIVPIIVTLLDDDDVEESKGVPVVPIMKLNWFLNDFF